jgi:MFS family permease
MSVLGERGYRNFWISGAFSDIGLNIWFLGAVWLVLNLTDSIAWVGLVGGITAAPALLTLLGGALGDRWNRRNIVVGSRAAWFAMGLAIALLVLTDSIEPWHILLGALSVALADSIGSPANGALIVDLVGKPKLLAATSMGELANYTGEIIAPLLVGVLIASIGIDSTFYAAAIALGMGVYFILRVPITPAVVDQSREQQNLLSDIRDGFRYARRSPGIAPLLLLAARMLFGAALFPMIPIYARDILEVGSTGFAVMMAALGAGFIVGSLVGALGAVGKRGLVIFGLIAVWDAGMVIFSQTDWYALTVALIFVMASRERSRITSSQRQSSN